MIPLYHIFKKSGGLKRGAAFLLRKVSGMFANMNFPRDWWSEVVDEIGTIPQYSC